MSYGRIPDEKQLFEVGDKLSHKGSPVTVERVSQQSIYYEHRPIASYQAFFYTVVDGSGNKLYLQTEDLTQVEQL
tara:strand:+ start:78 stop:302 length:225 start_codon:yes stop_codon:yes gene_type:complete